MGICNNPDKEPINDPNKEPINDPNRETINKTNKDTNNEIQINDEKQKTKKDYFFNECEIISSEELKNIFSNESSMCKIICQNGEKNYRACTGFFCEINDDNIPFKKALFTINYIFDESSLEINKEIEFEYLNKIKKIKITKERKIFTNKNLNYTCIEILDTDKINNTFFKIDDEIFKNKNNLIQTFIFVFHYPGDLSFSYGKILIIENDIITHNADTNPGSAGAPLIKRNNNNLVIGIHIGFIKNGNNLAIPFDIIIKNIKEQLNNIEELEKIKIEYEQEIIELRESQKPKENIA